MTDNFNANYYQYLEHGYSSTVECIINNNILASELSLLYNGTTTGDTIVPNIWSISSYLPNEADMQYTPLHGISLSSNYSAFGIVGSYSPNQHAWRFVPGWGYALSHDVQCEVYSRRRCSWSLSMISASIST